MMARFGLDDLGATSYRSHNLLAGLLLIRAVYESVRVITGLDYFDGTASVPQNSYQRSSYSYLELVHALVNIYFFPVPFFFYGFYYTDVFSACTVLYSYRCHLRNEPNIAALVGLLSLFFRQTNVFWIVVFLGGLEVCRIVPKGRADVEFPRQPTTRDVISGSWNHGCAYDPLVSEAGLEGLYLNFIPLLQT